MVLFLKGVVLSPQLLLSPLGPVLARLISYPFFASGYVRFPLLLFFVLFFVFWHQETARKFVLYFSQNVWCLNNLWRKQYTSMYQVAFLSVNLSWIWLKWPHSCDKPGTLDIGAFHSLIIHQILAHGLGFLNNKKPLPLFVIDSWPLSMRVRCRKLMWAITQHWITLTCSLTFADGFVVKNKQTNRSHTGFRCLYCYLITDDIIKCSCLQVE